MTKPNVTYRQLLEAINRLPLDHLDDNISVNTEEDEFIPVKKLAIQDEDDVLDKGHLYLILLS